MKISLPSKITENILLLMLHDLDYCVFRQISYLKTIKKQVILRTEHNCIDYLHLNLSDIICDITL